MALLRLENLTKTYGIENNVFSFNKRYIKAVDSVSLNLEAGQTLGLVGESGSGKSTLAKLILKLIPLTAGEIFFKSKQISTLSEQEFLPWRRKIQIVFQDPYGSLSPRLKVKQIIAEPLEAFNYSKRDIRWRIDELLVNVGLNEQHRERLPHQLSGGERQRVGIARALALKPELLILDEPVSSLDLSTQAQVLNLLVFLQNAYKLSFLFIAHNLSVIRYISDVVAVMYCGNIVELGKSELVYKNPIHPYTRTLIDSIPVLGQNWLKKINLTTGEERQGGYDIEFSGCKFYHGCLQRKEKCFNYKPELRQIGPGQGAACFYPLS